MCCLSVQACYVGDSCCAAVGNGDLVLLSAGPSYYATVNTVAVQARQAGRYYDQCLDFHHVLYACTLCKPGKQVYLLTDWLTIWLSVPESVAVQAWEAGLQLQCSLMHR